MAQLATSAPESALELIVGWAKDRPVWQQDALRRIIANELLTDAELKILERICRTKHGADASTDPLPAITPVSEDDIPRPSETNDSVSLISVGKLNNVNRIPSDQTLTLGTSPGLTIIYGDNGCGKSSYSRIIKKACRSRGSAQPIRPNAFAPKPKGPATAEIALSKSGVTKTVTWSDGASADDALSQVFVFDSITASNYIDEDGPASFTPRGLDVLPKLTKLCDLLKERLNTARNSLVAQNTATAGAWNFKLVTEVGKLINQLAAETPISEIERLTTITPEEERRFDDLTAALKSNPKQRAKETRATALRLRAFANSLQQSTATLADTHLAEVQKLISDTTLAEGRAKVFAETSFKEGYASGTGGELWRNLWESARAVSPEMFPGNEFPATSEEALCLLCQQELAEAARSRLKSFEDFCKNETKQKADGLAATLSAKTKQIMAVQPLIPILANVETDLAGIQLDLQVRAAEFVKSLDARLAKLKENLRQKAWTTPDLLPSSIEDDVRSVVATLEERAKTEESADNPTERLKLQSELDELTDRKALVIQKSPVLDQITRMKSIICLDNCLKDCSTNAATAFNKELAAKLITKAFCARFNSEILAIGLRTLRVELEEMGGQKGTTRFGLRLTGAHDERVRDIASEGEQRCIALASFLAELSLASNLSALVFDDPVSSLDLNHCHCISRRLVEEAKKRQVIVFTHNMVFLHDLLHAAEEVSAATTPRYLEWGSESPGLCYDGLPWGQQSPGDRINALENGQRALARAWAPQPTDSQKREMAGLYTELRGTIERIVERVLISDVVFRFRNYVNLRNLDNLANIPETECHEIDRLFHKCCDVTRGHDTSPATKVPEPVELSKDIADTKALLESIRARHKATKKK